VTIDLVARSAALGFLATLSAFADVPGRCDGLAPNLQDRFGATFQSSFRRAGEGCVRGKEPSYNIRIALIPHPLRRSVLASQQPPNSERGEYGMGCNPVG
jgi:hypothetical protein